MNQSNKIEIAWGDGIALCEDLAYRIQGYCLENQTAVDVLVVIPRGGLIPAERIARLMSLSSTKMVFACVAAYTVAGTDMTGTIETGQLPTRDMIEGKRVWVIDEVCDTGTTLAYTTKLLQSFAPDELHTAVLHYKPSNTKTGIKPDIFLEETDKWVVYPWEVPLKN